MKEREITLIDLQHPEISIIQSNVRGMYVMYDNQRDSIAITGDSGIVKLNIKQARELAKMIPDVLDMMKYSK